MREQFFATCPKGLELLLEEELENIGIDDTKQTVAGVSFQGTLRQALCACLWSRLANRILLPILHFKATDADDLYKKASTIAWSKHMDLTTTFRVDFHGKTEQINHTQFAAQKIKDAIVDQFRNKTGRRPVVEKKHPMLRIHAVLQKGFVTMSIDLSGESLHRRGYRLEGAIAPLKENLAAALLMRARWLEIYQKGGSLVDPMCGSGTLLIEALLMAADIAPGLLRKEFGFQGWKQFPKEIWQDLLLEAHNRAIQGKQKLSLMVYGFDIDPDTLEHAKANAERAQLSEWIDFQVSDISELKFTNEGSKYGLYISNPPYGERLEKENDLLPLYRSISANLKEHFLNWEAAILTGNLEIARKMGLRAYKKYAFYNGTIPCQLLLFHVQPEWFITQSSYQSTELP